MVQNMDNVAEGESAEINKNNIYIVVIVGVIFTFQVNMHVFVVV
jgi:hypothetical protein